MEDEAPYADQYLKSVPGESVQKKVRFPGTARVNKKAEV